MRRQRAVPAPLGTGRADWPNCAGPRASGAIGPNDSVDCTATGRQRVLRSPPLQCNHRRPDRPAKSAPCRNGPGRCRSQNLVLPRRQKATVRESTGGSWARSRLPTRAWEGTFISIRRVSELASGLTRNQMPRKGLWVRIPCPPLFPFAVVVSNLFLNHLRRWPFRGRAHWANHWANQAALKPSAVTINHRLGVTSSAKTSNLSRRNTRQPRREDSGRSFDSVTPRRVNGSSGGPWRCRHAPPNS